MQLGKKNFSEERSLSYRKGMMKAVSIETGEASKATGHGVNRGLSVFDLVLRIVAIVGTLAGAVAMGTAEQTLPFVTQLVQFSAQYDDFDSFELFVIVNAIACAYLALSLPFSIFHIIRSRAGKSRILLIFLDGVSKMKKVMKTLTLLEKIFGLSINALISIVLC